MAWRIAESLKTLRAQINAAYPNRDKASDGGIGNAEHASRNSDHNPWIKDKNGMGVVSAIDIDEDLASNIHSIEAVVSAIRASKDPRVKYIIYEKRITVAGSDLQKWKAYHGKNPHDHHAHISVNSDPKLYDSTKLWDIGLSKKDSTAQSSELANSQTDASPNDRLPADSEIVKPLNEPSIDTMPESLVPQSTPVIEVEQIVAAPDVKDEPPKEDVLTRIGNKAVALWAALGTALMAVGSWFASLPRELVIAVVGGGVVIGVAVMIIKAARQHAKDKQNAAVSLENARLEAALKLKREEQAFELQRLTLESAMRKDMNTVRLVPTPPPPTEIQNSDSEV